MHILLFWFLSCCIWNIVRHTGMFCVSACVNLYTMTAIMIMIIETYICREDPLTEQVTFVTNTNPILTSCLLTAYSPTSSYLSVAYTYRHSFVQMLRVTHTQCIVPLHIVHGREHHGAPSCSPSLVFLINLFLWEGQSHQPIRKSPVLFLPLALLYCLQTPFLSPSLLYFFYLRLTI